MPRKSDPVQNKQDFRESQVASLQVFGEISVENRAARRERKRHPRPSASILAGHHVFGHGRRQAAEVSQRAALIAAV